MNENRKPNSQLFLALETCNLIGEGALITRNHSIFSINSSSNDYSILTMIDFDGLSTLDQFLHLNMNTSNTTKSFLTPASIYVIEKMSHGFNRMGKAHGKGFYNYDTDPPTLWAGLKVFEKRNVNIPEQDILDRLLFATVIGALQTSEEEAAGIDPELKTYIPPEWPLSRQQALSWIDNYGEERFATRLAELAAAYGKRFSDPRKEQPAV